MFSDNESEAGRYRGLILYNLLMGTELQGPRRRSGFFGKDWHFKPSRVGARWVSFLGQGYFYQFPLKFQRTLATLLQFTRRDFFLPLFDTLPFFILSNTKTRKPNKENCVLPSKANSTVLYLNISTLNYTTYTQMYYKLNSPRSCLPKAEWWSPIPMS